MNMIILLISVVLILCVICTHLSDKLPIPSLLLFLIVGMLFGVDGIFKINFEDYAFTQAICSICLIFIMFYGGFGTNFKMAKPVFKESVLLASISVFLTALITGFLVNMITHIGYLESLLVGAVISSTDAASVFGILRKEKLNLKDNTASLLEVESGANDPMAYMLTLLLCKLIIGDNVNIGLLLVKQIVVAIGLSVVLSYICCKVLKKYIVSINNSIIFVLSMVLLCYAICQMFDGNGYLAIYLMGMIIGNSRIIKIDSYVSFFETISSIAQMMIFFLLGLLVTPSSLSDSLGLALIVMVILTFIARPISVAVVMLPFKAKFNQILLVSFAGLRGVASIVFAIMVVLSDVNLEFNIFNLVFCVVLISMGIQGTLLPFVSNKLKMIDNSTNVLKTFNDYKEESNITFVKTHIDDNSKWCNKQIKDLVLPEDFLIVLIIRDNENIRCNGDTLLQSGDLVVMASKEFRDKENLKIFEMIVDKDSSYTDKMVKDINMSKNYLIIMVKRNDRFIICDGSTMIKENDILVIAKY